MFIEDWDKIVPGMVVETCVYKLHISNVCRHMFPRHNVNYVMCVMHRISANMFTAAAGTAYAAASFAFSLGNSYRTTVSKWDKSVKYEDVFAYMGSVQIHLVIL